MHQHLGVRPDAGRDRLEVVPQVPPGQGSVAGENVRVGTGAVAVRASAGAGTFRTELELSGNVRRVSLGHTLPRGAEIASVTLEGRVTPWRVRETHRGLEVTVPVMRATGAHSVEIRTAG